MIAGVEVVMKNAEAGVVDGVLKITLVPRDRYVEMAAKHFKLLTDVVQATNVDKLNAILEAGRQRHAAVIRGLSPNAPPRRRGLVTNFAGRLLRALR
jgi:hypothetical protein